jgi:predicted amidohydrolase YtcJ
MTAAMTDFRAATVAPVTLHLVDLVLVGGKIWTGTEDDASTPNQVSAIAIRDGRVVAAGTDDELAPLAAQARRVIDLAGRRVLPGLIDSHIHAVRAGASWDLSLHWEDVRSLAEGLRQIGARASALEPGQWISVVGGWHSRQLEERRLPTREELDAVAPDNPVFIQELYDHGVVNSAGLAACGWDDSSADPAGGKLLRDAVGQVTGQIIGMGAFAVPLALALAATPEQSYSGTRAMFREFAAHGLTGVADGGGLKMTPHDYHQLFKLWSDDALAVRVRLFISAWTRGGEVGDVAALTEFLHPGFGDRRLRVVGLGEIPHLSCHDMEGLDPFVLEQIAYDELVEIVRMCAQASWPMSVHAVLEDSLSRVLDAWEQVESETGGVAGRRFSIVHADQASEESINRIAALGAGVLVQNRLMLKSTDYREGWGADAVRTAPPIGLMRAHGVTIGGGTDATRANWFSPWASIWWLVTGKSIDGAPPRDAEHLLSVEQALASYTRDAAWFTGEEHERGRLVPGYEADLCVPTFDPFECDTDALREIRSDLTIVGGAVTHASAEFSALRPAVD